MQNIHFIFLWCWLKEPTKPVGPALKTLKFLMDKEDEVQKLLEQFTNSHVYIL